MKIECILKRDPSTTVPMGDTTYEFKPDETGAHVCDVNDNDHIARFLSIPEGYRLPGDAPVPAEFKPVLKEVNTNQQTLTPNEADGFLVGSTVHPEAFDFGGEIGVLTIDDVVAMAHEASGLSTDDWNALTPEVRHDMIDIALEGIVPPSGSTGGAENPGNASDSTGDASGNTDADANTEAGAGAGAGVGAGAGDGDKTPSEDDQREALAIEYKEKHGVRPHHKWSLEKVREELAKPVKAKEGK